MDAYSIRAIEHLREYDAAAALRVAFYSPSLPDSGAANGIVTYVRIMRDALRALGHQVMVVTTDSAEGFDGEVVTFPPPNSLSYRARALLSRADGAHPWARIRVAAAFRYAKRNGAQIFEIEESFGWSRGLRGLPVVVRLHGPATLADEGGEKRKLAEQRALSKARFITCPSERLLDRIAPQARIAEAIPNPVEIPECQWAYSGQQQILCVGRNDRRKGADIALAAFALARHPSLKLVMAGPGFERAESQDGITFLGPQTKEQLNALRLQSAFSLVTSRFECSPYSIAEAMAVGMPVLASDSFGNSELVRDGVEGRVVPVEDIEATAGAMVELIENPDRLTEMGAAARKRAEEWLSPKRIARRTAELYHDAYETR